MTGCACPKNGVKTINAVPARVSNNTSWSSNWADFWLFKLQKMAVKERNQINTDRSTCTTRAVWKKSIHGMKSEIAGVLDKTSSIENIPDAIRAKMPRKNQPFETLSCVGLKLSSWNVFNAFGMEKWRSRQFTSCRYYLLELFLKMALNRFESVRFYLTNTFGWNSIFIG